MKKVIANREERESGKEREREGEKRNESLLGGGKNKGTGTQKIQLQYNSTAQHSARLTQPKKNCGIGYYTAFK
jgi:hypothetical protein